MRAIVGTRPISVSIRSIPLPWYRVVFDPSSPSGLVFPISSSSESWHLGFYHAYDLGGVLGEIFGLSGLNCLFKSPSLCLFFSSSWLLVGAKMKVDIVEDTILVYRGSTSLSFSFLTLSFVLLPCSGRAQILCIYCLCHVISICMTESLSLPHSNSHRCISINLLNHTV